METLIRSTLAVLGAGAIGSAVIERLLAVGVPATHIRAVETRPERREEFGERFGIAVSEDPGDAVSADLLVVAVPPSAVLPVLDRIEAFVLALGEAPEVPDERMNR